MNPTLKEHFACFLVIPDRLKRAPIIRPTLTDAARPDNMKMALKRMYRTIQNREFF